jgi:transposase
VYELARQLGIVHALGTTRAGKLALWQVIARVIDQGSRLSAVRLAGMHAVCDVLSLTQFNEDDLYENLDWLCQQQSTIEDRLATKRGQRDQPAVFFYDVTSSYVEGDQNELAAFGYNRDGKKGKPQIVIGLLCDVQGKPLSIELFAGNTQDPQTVAAQVRKVADRFGGGAVIFVGDRGMLKSQPVAELKQHGFDYITAITKPQIGSLLQQGVLDLDGFQDEVIERLTPDGLRYILRRKPIRVQEIQKSREDKAQALEKVVAKQNQYLAEHPRAKVDVALRKLNAQCKQLKIANWASVVAEGRGLSIAINAEAKAEAAKLDGCYVLKTELDQNQVSKEVIHQRYKDLALVEWAFRSCKTSHLEIRPIYVRLAKRTRAHALVVMLAYHIIMELRMRWQSLNLTVEEGIEELTHLCSMEVHVTGKPPYHEIPAPRDLSCQLLEAAQVRLPRVLPSQGIAVTTKKPLPPKRKTPLIRRG